MTPSGGLAAIQLLQSSSLPALVQAEIERLILRGELAIGQRINESELAIRFGTSRGPVREALRALEECRLVRSEKNRGVFVREIAVEEADEIYDVREVLDEFIGRRVAERISPEQLAKLRAVLQDMQAAIAARDVEQYYGLNLRFHELLVEFAGNARLTEAYQRLTKELLLFRLRGLTNGGGLAVSSGEHGAIVDALEARDARRAGWLLRQHAANSRARMHRAVGSGATDRPVSPVPE
jgi:phosphonate utilization transcriptional regulator